MENEELIRQDMAQTRDALTDKLETLENRLLGSVHEASSAVRDAMGSVKETVRDSVDSVKAAVDVQAHVQRRPWLMFGGAVLGGYLLGSLLVRETERRRPEPTPPAPVPTPPPQQKRPHSGNGHHLKQPAASATAPEPPPAKPNPILAAIEPEIRQIKGIALGVMFGTVREMVTKEVPPHLAGELGEVIDSITRKIGGEPLPSADLPFASTCAGESSASAFEAEKPRW